MNPLVLSGLFTAAQSLIERFFPDPAQKAAAQLDLLKMQQNGELAALAAETDLAKAQIAVNVEEAKNASIFVSGWRPAVGWVGALGLGYATIFEPFLRFLSQVGFKYAGQFPVIDTTLTLQILLGLLGLSGMRTWEKGKGVAAK